MPSTPMHDTDESRRRNVAGIEYAPTRQTNAVASSSPSSFNFWSPLIPEFVPAASSHHHDSDSGSDRPDARLRWSVGWSTVPANDTELGWTGPGPGPGETRRTTQYGAWVEFRFNGSAIEVIVPPSAPRHTLYVILDHDALHEDHDGACSAKAPCPESVRWRVKGLGRTEHMIRVKNFYAGEEIGRAMDLTGFSVYPHRPTIFGVPISPSTATLFLLVALLAFLHGLFLYVRRRNNRKVLRRRREMGLDSRCDSYGYPLPLRPEDALEEGGGGGSDSDEHWRILEDMSRGTGAGRRGDGDDDDDGASGSSSDGDDDEVLGAGGERRTLLGGRRGESRRHRRPVELGLDTQMNVKGSGEGEGEGGEEFFRPLEDPPPRYSAE